MAMRMDVTKHVIPDLKIISVSLVQKNSSLERIRYYPMAMRMDVTKHFIPDLKVISVSLVQKNSSLELSINHSE